jgi:hypothetical protein
LLEYLHVCTPDPYRWVDSVAAEARHLGHGGAASEQGNEVARALTGCRPVIRLGETVEARGRDPSPPVRLGVHPEKAALARPPAQPPGGEALIALTAVPLPSGVDFAPGAIGRAFAARTPKATHGRSWLRPVDQVVSAVKLPAGDPRTLPDSSPWPKGAGAVWACSGSSRAPPTLWVPETARIAGDLPVRPRQAARA